MRQQTTSDDEVAYLCRNMGWHCNDIFEFNGKGKERYLDGFDVSDTFV